jgi:hypothetical protein
MIESIREAFDRIGWFELVIIVAFVYCVLDSAVTHFKLRRWTKEANRKLAQIARRVHDLEVSK